ncbi:MAG: hypothetical protein WA900_08620 [Casimicrobiaceae bacterium]
MLELARVIVGRPTAQDGRAAAAARSCASGWLRFIAAWDIGASFALVALYSDVQIADPYIRRVVLARGAVAFFYTIGILALMINLVAGLITTASS